ncbi:MAG TPA: chemotaxis protein CheW [Planctomycetales bacterium]|jgi:purine-binding chemotaxis protein CheW|nr:chemotaxis protein CheW [Planctomycetales bacterium]
MSANRQYCTFYLDDIFFGVEVEKVQEVVSYQEMTRVPLAPPVVRGLINLRGQIVTALDLRRRLDMPERPAGRNPVNVVVRADDVPTSLLVDQIGDVLEVSEEAFERPPETLRGPARELIHGAYKLKDRLLLILNMEKVVSVTGEAE